MFRSALLVLSGNAAASLLLLARNLIVARLIPVADYGVAATFAIAMALVEMMSALGLQQQIVQARNGEDPHFQAALQGFQALRGTISGIALFLLAGPIADFMAVPEAAWAYRVMALVPVLNGFAHFDIYRFNRRMLFRPAILTGAVPALLSVLAVWPLALWYGDYRVMLWAIILQSIAALLTSHLVAQRRYRLVLDRGVMAGALRFGWPILINGALLFAVFNGDRIIVGRELGLEMLAIFSMGVTLTLTPTLVMDRSLQSFFLPQLSAIDRTAPDGEERFRHMAMVTMEVALILSLLLVLGVALVGGPLVHFLLGDKYLALLPYLVWLAITQAIRVAKQGPSTVALADGSALNALVATLFRVAALPLVWYVVVTTGDLILVIWVTTGAEILGNVAALLMSRHQTRLHLRPLLFPYAWAICLIITAGAFAATFLADPAAAARFASPLQTLILIVLVFAVVFSSADLRRYVSVHLARGAKAGR